LGKVTGRVLISYYVEISQKQTVKAKWFQTVQKHKKQAVFSFHLWDNIMMGWKNDGLVGL